MAKRPPYPMPADVRATLRNGAAEAPYEARPHYQQKDYVGWVTRSKLPATRDKRVSQMVAELRKGGVYMGMRHAPSVKT